MSTDANEAPKSRRAHRSRKRRPHRPKKRDGQPFQWIYTWVIPAGAVVAAAFVPVLWDLEPVERWQDRLTSVPSVASAILLLVALLLTFVQGLHSVREHKRIQGTLETFNHALGDTVRALGYLIDSTKGPDDRQAFFRSMVAEAKAVVPLSSPRVCVYELEAGESETDSKDYLRLTAFGGRLDPPRNSFASDTAWGQDAIDVARGTATRCVDDHRHSHIEVQRDPDALWHSFMMVPLHVDNVPRGLLTIDTTKKTRFSLEQIAVARTVGKFIEMGMKGVYDAAQDTRPEVREVLQILQRINGAKR